MERVVGVNVEIEAGVEKFEAPADLMKIFLAGSSSVIVVEVGSPDNAVGVVGADTNADIGRVFPVGEVVPFTIEVGFVTAEELSGTKFQCDPIFASGDGLSEISGEFEVEVAAARVIAGWEKELGGYQAASHSVVVLRLAGIVAIVAPNAPKPQRER